MNCVPYTLPQLCPSVLCLGTVWYDEERYRMEMCPNPVRTETQKTDISSTNLECAVTLNLESPIGVSDSGDLAQHPNIRQSHE